MTPSHRRYRCRSCGARLPAWLPWAKAPDGALLLGHLAQQHPDEVGAYLDRMAYTEDIGRIAAEAYEVVEGQTWPRLPLHLCGMKPTVSGRRCITLAR
jgi:hypothetical protein